MKALIILIFLLSACSQENQGIPTTGVELADRLERLNSHTPVKLLFVMTAKRALVERSGDHYELTLFKSDDNKIIAFTDRPQRLAFNVSLPMLGALWDSGKESFEKVPPNAVLVGNTQQLSITELIKLDEDEYRIIFRMNNTAYEDLDIGVNENALGYPVLFIDASVFTAGSLAFALRAGAKACAEVECWWALAGG